MVHLAQFIMARNIPGLIIFRFPSKLAVSCLCGRTISSSCLRSYKSQYSLENVYPNSSLNIAKKPELPQSDNETFSGFIPMDKLTLTYSASSGPGGQNVNKVHTKVDLRFHVESATWVPEPLKPKILEVYKSMINKEGFLVLKSERTRSQIYNVADCLDKLRYMIREVDSITNRPPQTSAEELTVRLKRQEKAARERLKEKRFHSDVKSSRGAATLD